ncbi:separin homolog sep-1-like, partial [Hyposmocoma kahamanoa]|uniref:separin homolog sep-1-like n=1 Tax=Hyposmocoma kahamanoa TaxID=1477025 RepID=UPI000E6D9326
KNLDRMEKRMSSFVRYWCESWTGHIGEPPEPADFLKYLTEADVFLFCGHGDGCRFASGGAGAGVEGARGAGVAVLSGCGSVRLLHPPGRGAPAAAHHHLHIAGSPMVVGMLWEVTDLEVDKVVSTLLSLYVPSTAPLPWAAVGKAKWSQGILDTTAEPKSQFVPEPNLLLAISRARGSSNFVMIASSVVARGLPMRIGA